MKKVLLIFSVALLLAPQCHKVRSLQPQPKAKFAQMQILALENRCLRACREVDELDSLLGELRQKSLNARPNGHIRVVSPLGPIVDY